MTEKEFKKKIYEWHNGEQEEEDIVKLTNDIQQALNTIDNKKVKEIVDDVLYSPDFWHRRKEKV